MRQQQDANPLDSMILAGILLSLFSLPVWFLYPPRLSSGAVFALLYMGAIQIGCASLLFSYGILRVRAVSAMLLSSIEPVLNPVWVLLATGERPTADALLGGAVIIVAVIISSGIFPRRHHA
jgi:drug/metabolite transporter (DMT)-like permease